MRRVLFITLVAVHGASCGPGMGSTVDTEPSTRETSDYALTADLIGSATIRNTELGLPRHSVPFNGWMTSEAYVRFFSSTYWSASDPDWLWPDAPSAQWTTLRASPSCADIELQCRFKALATTGASFCDALCGAQGLLCSADELWDNAFALPEPCDTEGCGSATASLRDGVSQLVEAGNRYYEAAAALMHGLSQTDVTGSDSEGLSCLAIHEEDILSQLPTASSLRASRPERYAQKAVYAMERFVASYSEAVGRLLARADAGYGRSADADEAAVQEWFDDASPRATAIQLLLGSGLRLFPCTVDPSPLRTPRRIYVENGSEPNAEAMDLCKLGSVAGVTESADCPAQGTAEWSALADAVLAELGTSRTAFNRAVVSEAEKIRTTHTAADPSFPARVQNPQDSLGGAIKPFELWRADGTADETNPQKTLVYGVCFGTRQGYSNYGTPPPSADPFDRESPPVYALACTMSPGWSSGDRVYATGAINALAGLRTFWGEIVASYPSAELADITAALERLAGAAEFRVGMQTRLSFLAPQGSSSCVRAQFDREVILQVESFSDKLASAGVAASLPSGSGWIDMTTIPPELRFVARQHVSYGLRGEPLPADPIEEWDNAIAPQWCQYNGNHDAIRCGFVANYPSESDPPLNLPSQTLNLQKLAEIPDYVGGLSDVWKPGGTAAFDDSPEQTRRQGIWVAMLGTDIVGWLNAHLLEGVPYEGVLLGRHCLGTDAPTTGLCNSVPDACDEAPNPAFTKSVDVYSGGVLDSLARQVIDRNELDCRYPRINSLGLPGRLVPPLENEATTDAVPYESAYRTYLASATDATSRAAQLALEAERQERTLERAEESYAAVVDDAIAGAAAEAAVLCGPEALGEGGVGVCEVPLASIADAVVSDWIAGFAAEPAAIEPEPQAGAPTAMTLEELREVQTSCQQILSTAVDGLCANECNLNAFSNFIINLEVSLRCGNAPECAGFDFYFQHLRNQVVCRSFDKLMNGIEPILAMQLPAVIADDGRIDSDEVEAVGGELRQVLGNIESNLDRIRSSAAVLGHELRATDTKLLMLLEEVKLATQGLTGDQECSVSDVVALNFTDFNPPLERAACVFSVFWREGACLWQAARCVQDDVRLENELRVQAINGKREALVAAQTFAEQLENTLAEINQATDNIRAAMWTIDDIRLRADLAAARADRAVRIATAESLATDPWTRKTFGADSRRARDAFDHARKLSFIARRAVEFRFVVDLERLTNATLLGDVPADWATDVFVDGYTSDAPVDRFMKPTVDFVQRLTDFVAFNYSASYPFQNGTRTVVVSLKDNIIGGQFECCDPETPCPIGEQYWNKRPCGETELLNADGDVVLRGDGSPMLTATHEYDYDGVLLRGTMRKMCRVDDVEFDVPSRLPCSSTPGVNSEVLYYFHVFSIQLEDFGALGSLSQLGITADNYNYRIRDIAVNLVGTDVLDCSLVTDQTSNCFASAFIPYDLVQAGIVHLRDHGSATWEYLLPEGGIRGGQALAAERLITSPIASADLALISQYWAQEFRGRPLQGEFELRLYAVDEFNFDELQDIQLVVQLDYWSPFEAVP